VSGHRHTQQIFRNGHRLAPLNQFVGEARGGAVPFVNPDVRREMLGIAGRIGDIVAMA
jgi:hypothetical protein